MKRTPLDFINLFLLAVLLGILSVFAYSWIANKEYDKLYWKAEIGSSTGNSSPLKSNTIQIIDALFLNSFNHSSLHLDSESKLMISATSKDSIYFRSEKELLPDSLHLKYFSIEERQFYKVNAKLPKFLLKKTIKNRNYKPKFFLEIQPKGNVILKIFQKDLPSKTVAKFEAEKTTGNLEDLVYEIDLGKKYNRFETITTIQDYADLFQNEYLWGFQTVLEDGSTLEKAYTYSFDQESQYDLEDLMQIKKRKIPQTFHIDWQKSKKNRIQFTMDPNEILQAFKTLDKVEGNDPVMIIFKLFQNQMPECQISKGGTVLILKELYPSLPD